MRVYFPFLELASFSQKVIKVYTREQQSTPLEQLLVFAGLAMICADLSASGGERDGEHYRKSCSRVYEYLPMASLSRRFPMR